MQMYPTSINFYNEALTNSGGFSIIYEYAFSPIQPPDIFMLKENLRVQYRVDIILEGLQYIITSIQQEHNEKPISLYQEIKQSQPWEYLVTNLFKLAGIPFPSEIIDFAHQTKHLITDATPETFSMNITKRMNWIQFETFLQKFFETKGYQVTKTKKSHDFGADLILKKPGENTTVVQVKKWKKKRRSKTNNGNIYSKNILWSISCSNNHHKQIQQTRTKISTKNRCRMLGLGPTHQRTSKTQ